MTASQPFRRAVKHVAPPTGVYVPTPTMQETMREKFKRKPVTLAPVTFSDIVLDAIDQGFGLIVRPRIEDAT